ncbi:lipoprotein [Streptomyces sp. NPDC058751]|uniref:lipoprotein n=1 Tax=Streptomyces sp. NPDC058751 TaxID=3346623 RepID=UPI0036ADBE0C
MRRTLLTALSAAALTGCSFLGPGAPCTLADADSGVSAKWRPADFGGLDAATIRLCVNSVCEERKSGDPDDPFMSLSVRLPDDVGAATLPVRLSVTSTKSGDTVVEDGVRARLKEYRPNGTSCPPGVWTATFRAHPVKGLTSPEGLKLRR